MRSNEKTWFVSCLSLCALFKVFFNNHGRQLFWTLMKYILKFNVFYKSLILFLNKFYFLVFHNIVLQTPMLQRTVDIYMAPRFTIIWKATVSFHGCCRRNLFSRIIASLHKKVSLECWEMYVTAVVRTSRSCSFLSRCRQSKFDQKQRLIFLRKNDDSGHRRIKTINESSAH